jgi:hypothetical protein
VAVMVSSSAPMAVHNSSRVRAAAFRSSALSLAKSCSIVLT